MSAEDARSQIIGVVIYLNGHKPIHIHLGDVCIFDNERKAYRPKDGFDYVSFAVPEISVVLNQQHSQQKSATDNDKSTNSSNPTPKQIKKISPDLRTRMQQKLGARDSPTDTTKHRTSELLAHTNLVNNRRNNLLRAAKKAGDKGLCKALGVRLSQ
jgi:hypothetical protein